MPQLEDGLQQWEKFSECITPAISNVVSFAKSIPGFQLFGHDDQVTLLKVGHGLHSLGFITFLSLGNSLTKIIDIPKINIKLCVQK